MSYRFASPLRYLAAAILFSTLLAPLDPGRVSAQDTEPPQDPSTGTLEIWVSAADSGDRLGGACWSVTDADGVSTSACDNDGDGLTTVPDLPAGAVSAQQTSTAHDGYPADAGGTTSIVAGEPASLYLSSSPVAASPPAEEPAANDDPSAEPLEDETPVDQTADDGSDESSGDRAEETEPLQEPLTPNDSSDFSFADNGDPLFSISCSYNPDTGLTSFTFTVLLEPNQETLTVTYTPFDLQLNELDPIVSNDYSSSFPDEPWRLLEVFFERGIEGSETYVWGEAEAGCNTSNQLPSIATQPYNSTTDQPILNGRSVPAGDSIHDTATLTNQTVNAGGTATYRLYRGDSCTGEPVFTETVDVVNGLIPDSSSYTPPDTPEAEGLYNWQVTYNGDDLNDSVTSTCGAESLVYGQMNPTIVTEMRDGAGNVVAPGGSIFVDGAISDLGILQGASAEPGGTVTYELYAGAPCEGTLLETFPDIPLGTPSPPAGPLPIGAYYWVATYSGDELNRSAVSDCEDEPFNVVKRQPTLTTTPERQDGDLWIAIPDGGEIPVDTVVRDTAQLAGATSNASGDVTYYLWAGSGCDIENPDFTFGPVPVADGVAEPSPAHLFTLPGTYNWQAVYIGDDNNESASSPCGSETVVVERLSPTITTLMWNATVAPAVEVAQDGIIDLPAEVYDTATLSGATSDAGGTVTFSLYRGYLCNAESLVGSIEADVVDGVVEIPVDTISITEPGTYNWVATYSGDERNAPATSGCGDETFHAEQGSGAVTTQVRENGTNAAVGDGSTWEVGDEHYDTATLLGFTPDAGGTITYYLYFENDCVEGAHIESFGPYPVDNRDAGNSAADFWTYTQPGRYEWQAVYSGDENNQGATSPCGGETVIIDRRTTSVSTTMYLESAADGPVIDDDESILVPFDIEDTATIDGALTDWNEFGGTVQYLLYNNAECEGTPIFDSDELPIAGGIVPTSGVRTLTAPTIYNWVVVYSGDTIHQPSSSSCGDETVYGQVQPTISTIHYANGVELGIDAEIPLSSIIFDTATLEGASPTPASEVVYTLYAGEPCQGEPIWVSPTLVVGNDGVIPDSPELSADYSGQAYWVVSYAGNPTNLSAESDCTAETFTVLPGEPTLSTHMFRGPDAETQTTTVGQATYQEVPGWFSDRALILGVPITTTGEITYELYLQADEGAGPCAGAPIHTSTHAVSDILAIPHSTSFNATELGIYNWVVTFTPDGPEAPQMISGCGEETFVGVGSVSRQIAITCTYFPASRTSSFVVTVPKLSLIAPDYDPPVGFDPGLVIVATPTALNNRVLPGITYHNYNSSIGPNNPDFVQEPWRTLEIFVTFPDGVTGTATAGCNTARMTPTIETVMVNETGTVIPNGTDLDIDDQIGDTVILHNATIDFTGEFEYRLYNNGNCAEPAVFVDEQPVTTPGVAPPSELYTLVSTGQYRWVVSYSGDALNEPYTSGCREEHFSVDDGPIPAQPQVDGDACVGGVYEPPVIEIADGNGITYNVEQQPDEANGWTFIIRAELTSGQVWGDLTGTGWVAESDTEATYEGAIEPALCIPAEPVLPDVDGNACIDDVYHEPIVTIEDEDGVIQYVIVEAPTSSNDGYYYITATIIAEGYGWGDLTGTGWVIDSPLEAHLEGNLELDLCVEEVIPVEPEIEGNVCAGGVYTPPTVVPVETEGVVYTIVEQPTEDNGWTYIVEAEIVDDGYAWGDLSDSDWVEISPTLARLTVTIEPDLCVPVVPIVPDIEGNFCIDGVFTPPEMVPVPMPGVIYFIFQQPAAENNWTYVVYALIIEDGYEWGSLILNGWIRVTSTLAFRVGEVEPALCEPVTPVAPSISGNSCVDGIFIPPTVVPGTTDGIEYTIVQEPTADNGWTYIVQAEIVADGIAWGDLTGTGWTVVDATTATYTDEIELNECGPVIPITPSVEGNVCTGGVLIPPTVVPGTTVGIEYTVIQAPTADNDWTYIVQAEIVVDGIGWGDLTETGWTEVDATTATYTNRIELNECEPVVPVAPEISGNNCVDGVFTPPSIELAATPDGVSYSLTMLPSIGSNWFYLVTATIEADGIAWGDLTGTGWLRLDADTAVYLGRIQLNECREVVPVTPSVTGNACLGGEFIPPSPIFPITPGVSYSVVQQPVEENGWTYIIMAEISAPGYAWGDLSGSNWVVVSPTQATLEGQIDPGLCTEVIPVAPSISGNACIDGVFRPPELVLPGTEGIAYTVVTPPTADNDWTYLVRAELVSGAYAWGDLTGTGWTEVDATTATYEDQIEPNQCESVVPVAPEISGNSCLNGVFTPPAVELATEPDGVSYALRVPPTAGTGWTYIVTATIEADGITWGDLTGSSWIRVDELTAVYLDTIELNECDPVRPVAPEISGNSCVDGVSTPPTVELATAPDGVDYALTTPPTAGNNWTYVVTATIEVAGIAWAELTGTGWTRVDDVTATYTDQIELDECDPVVPVTPVISGNACRNGAFVPPAIVPGTIDGIEYSALREPTAENGWTYVVQAEIVADGIAWGDLTGAGWTEVDATTATYSSTIELEECELVLPATPSITGNSCNDGVFTPPTVVPAPTPEGVTYTIATLPQIGNNSIYFVIATIRDDGIAWGDLSGTGWIRISAIRAFFAEAIALNGCEPVRPVAPEISGNSCVDGLFTPPTVEPASTPDGVRYALTTPPTAGNNWTYVVTATIEVDGIAWGDLTGTGWTEVDPTTATYTETIDADACNPVVPVTPTITGNACVNGVFVPPSVVPGTTAGVDYSVVQQPTAGNGWRYIVRAEIVADGIAWGDLPGGWIEESATVAVLTGTVDPVPCKKPEKPDPEKPEPPKVTELPNTGAGLQADTGVALLLIIALATGFATAGSLIAGRTRRAR